MTDPASPPAVDAIAEAASHLRAGGVVAFPTETVYGLGADTYDVNAIDRVFALKGRPADNPLIAHVLDIEQARALATGWDGRCDELARRFWPGPLTLVVARAPTVPSAATAGRPTIAVRCPSHPAARALLEAFGGPISAPSANRSGHVSPTCAAHVAADFAAEEDLLILDGGACDVGIESTVLDVTVSPPAVLRPGSVTVEDLEPVIGAAATPRPTAQAASPGTSPVHYAPATPAALVRREDLPARLAQLKEPVVVLCLDSSLIRSPHRAIAMPGTADRYAAGLYEALRRADEMGLGVILIEEPGSDEGLWRAIRDRLRRATGRRRE